MGTLEGRIEVYLLFMYNCNCIAILENNGCASQARYHF